MNDKKTADYTRRAIDKYQLKKDIITVATDKGTKDRIKAIYGEGVNVAEYIRGLIEADLKTASEGVKTDEPREQGTTPNPFDDL